VACGRRSATSASRLAYAHALLGDPALGLDADLRVTWRAAGTAAAVISGLAVDVAVPAAPVAVGERAELAVTLRNPRREVAMPTVVLPVPPGFRGDVDSLEARMRRHGVARFTDQGREIHLYLTSLPAGAELTLPIVLEATAACRVLLRPTEVYADYDPTVRGASGAAMLAARAAR
jgi:hypothetical protein